MYICENKSKSVFEGGRTYDKYCLECVKHMNKWGEKGVPNFAVISALTKWQHMEREGKLIGNKCIELFNYFQTFEERIYLLLNG